jgi:hypothetical protein
MFFELWETAQDDGTPEHLFIPDDSPKRALLTVGQRLIWTVEAPSWGQAMALYHDHMGWEPYVPMEESGPS